MPTAQEWKAALVVPRRVHVESSAELVAQVQSRQQSRAQWLQARALPNRAKPAAVFAPFFPQKHIAVCPIDLLHAIGLTTSPAIPNLVDICSWWAYYRYLWAFALPTARQSALRLSAEAREIDFHQKALLSDEVGVGMASYLMATYCGAPQSIDVDVAIRRQALPVARKYETSPDYIFFDAAQTHYFVVECKGTQTTRSVALNQLQRGTEQVPSLMFTNGTPALPLVVATHLGRKRTSVYVIDPPADDPPPDSKRMRDSKPRERDSNRWEVEDWRGFAAAARTGVQARLLAFAGDDAAALERLSTIVPVDGTRRPQKRRLQTRDTVFGEYQGVEDVLPSRDGVRLAVFHGVQRQVLERAQSADDQAFIEAIAEVGLRAEGRKSRFGIGEKTAFEAVVTQDSEEAVEVSSAGPEGTLLEMRIEVL